MIGCELIPLHETNSYINQVSKLQYTSQMYLYKWMVKDKRIGIFLIRNYCRKTLQNLIIYFDIILYNSKKYPLIFLSITCRFLMSFMCSLESS